MPREETIPFPPAFVRAVRLWMISLTAFAMEQRAMNDRFYDSTKWKTKKEHILRRDSYQCQVSKRFGRLIPAELVHHVFPLEEFPEYAYADWNLISISQKVHNKLHDRQTNELTEEGRQLLERIARKNNIAVPEKYKHPIRRRGYNGRPAVI